MEGVCAELAVIRHGIFGRRSGGKFGSRLTTHPICLTRADGGQVSVIKVFETASRANGGRLWLVWLMTLRGSPLVLQAA
jgi:hypothetical protein